MVVEGDGGRGRVKSSCRPAHIASYVRALVIESSEMVVEGDSGGWWWMMADVSSTRIQ